MSWSMDALYDTHMHIWDPGVLTMSWLDGVPELDRVIGITDYLADAEDLGITDAIYIEVEVDPASFDAEYAAGIALMDAPGSIVRGAVMGGRPDEPGFPAWLDHLAADSRIRGVREVLHAGSRPSGRCLGDAFKAGIRLLGERGLSFDLCMRVGELSDAASLIRDCPGTRFILDHFGNPPVEAGVTDAWRRDLEKIAALPNAFGKMSGLIQNTKSEDWTTDDFAPFIDALVESFGHERIIWASNWPVCTLNGSLRRWVETTREVLEAYPEDVRQAICNGNARNVYSLGD